MLLPAPTFLSLIECKPLFALLASVASAIAVWAQTHAGSDRVEDAVEHVRHPFRAACRHPIRTIARRFGRVHF
jgi:hypothetical protein